MNRCMIVLIFILVVMIGKSLENKPIENNQENIEEIKEVDE